MSTKTSNRSKLVFLPKTKVQRSSVLDFIIFQYPRGMFPTNMDKGIRLVKELRETAGFQIGGSGGFAAQAQYCAFNAARSVF